MAKSMGGILNSMNTLYDDLTKKQAEFMAMDSTALLVYMLLTPELQPSVLFG